MAKESFMLIMPVYNEVECIGGVITSWINLIRKYPGSEMLVMDGGSTDGTKEILSNLNKRFKELKVISKSNEDYGPSIVKGYTMATKTNHKWVFQTDSDNQFPTIDFKKLWVVRDNSDFILGCRSKRDDPLHRIVLTKIMLLFNTLVFGSYVKDINIPYRLIKASYLKKLLNVLPKDLFAPNVFLTILAVKDNQNLMDITISHRKRETGESIVKWKLIKGCFRGLKELILFRFSLSSRMDRLRKK